MPSKSAITITRSRLPHQGNWASAFAEGLKRHGWSVEHLGENEYKPADMVCMWGIRRSDVIDQARNDRTEICILERGYVGNRKEYSSVSFGGGLNGRGEFRGPLTDPSRWGRHFAQHMREYDTPNDGYALIMGQVPGDSSVKGVDLDKWQARTTEALREAGWSDVRYRPHPVFLERTGRSASPLEDDLKGAKLIITYNSNSGVDAMLYGRPVVAFDEGSMVWPIAGRSVNEMKEPDRAGWAHAMAWKQWTKDEMASGECWAAIGDHG